MDLTFGAIYNAEITEVRENGVMVLLKKDTRPIFLRNSELSPQPVKHASALGLKVDSDRQCLFGTNPVF